MNTLEIVLKYLKIRGKTEYKVLKEVGLSKNFFQNWKNGSEPGIEKVKSIAIYLGIPPEEILNYKIEEPNLTENEKEMLSLFQKLSDREQIKEIGRLEDRVKQLNEMEGSSNSENDKAG